MLASRPPGEAAKFEENVHFLEEARILEKVDRIAKNRGSDRSALYREAMRYWLAVNGELNEGEMYGLSLGRVLQKSKGVATMRDFTEEVEANAGRRK